MRRMLFGIVVVACGAVWLAGLSNAESEKPFAPNVDVTTGALRVPENYTEWPTLGTWAHANTDEKLEKSGPGLHEYHTVYTQPSTIAHYKKTGQFPDGAVLVKELLNAETMAMSTGPAVGHATTLKGWFVLVRDTKGRYKDSMVWGDGWAWGFFNKGDMTHSVTKNYKVECIPCHIPAKSLAPANAAEADKWIYTLGYPILQKQ